MYVKGRRRPFVRRGINRNDYVQFTSAIMAKETSSVRLGLMRIRSKEIVAIKWSEK